MLDDLIEWSDCFERLSADKAAAAGMTDRDRYVTQYEQTVMVGKLTVFSTLNIEHVRTDNQNV